MPPNPPFDITTTRSPGRRSRAIVSTMSSIEAASRAACAALLEIANQRRHRQPLRLRAAWTGTPGASSDLVGGGKRVREVVLEHPPARRRRSRLEDRPDARAGIRRRAARPAFPRPRSDGARNRRTRSRPPASPTTSSRRLTPANRRRPSAIRSALMPDFRRHRDRRQRVPDVVRADERHLERAERRPAAPDVKSRRRARAARGRAPASRRRRRCRTSPPARRAAPSAPAPPGCRRRAGAALAAAPGSPGAGTPA